MTAPLRTFTGPDADFQRIAMGLEESTHRCRWAIGTMALAPEHVSVKAIQHLEAHIEANEALLLKVQEARHEDKDLARVVTLGDSTDSPTASACGGAVGNDQHSRLPWRIAHADGAVIKSGEWFVARCHPDADYSDEVTAETNARFIVTAVNCHAELLAACKEALLWYGPDGDHVSDPARGLLLAAIAHAETR